MWCIPPKQDAAFVCAMEPVLDVYTRPLDPAHPMVCMDETTKHASRPAPLVGAIVVAFDLLHCFGQVVAGAVAIDIVGVRADVAVHELR